MFKHFVDESEISIANLNTAVSVINLITTKCEFMVAP